MIYPSSIQKGDNITLISPSNGLYDSKLLELDKSIEVLQRYGYNIVEDNYTRNSTMGCSSDRMSRAKELNKSFNDNSKVLIAVSGGDFINQIMDKLQFRRFLNNIKWIQGHSDITVLLYYITTNYDVATIYNFNVRGYLNNNKRVVEYGMNAIQKRLFLQKSFSSWKVVNNFKKVNGRIIGGCLESLKDIFGTKYDSFKKFEKKYKKDGIIWYFDISTFTNEDISRTLWQLNTMGYFKYCKAIMFSKIENEVNYTGINLEKAITDEIGHLNIPIIIGCDIGHISSVITIINGSLIEITQDNNEFIITTRYD
ncbi:MAG: LD-carboxypeptidase [Bacilli bacterium]|nr:LD-carboxypeptidase [Bacilli bacterium]